MGRSDRLYALVEELRARSPRPVPRHVLAGTLEVSTRTIERDVLTLQQAGVPIWTERGRRGGYALDSRWSLPPINLDAAEGLALAAALTASASIPFGSAARRAALKLLAAMPSDEAEKARSLSSRVRVERPRVAGDAKVVAAIEDAVLGREVVEIHYLDSSGASTVRPVEAHGLQISPTGSYLLAWCRLRDGARTFRLDRIGAVRRLGEVAPERVLDDLTVALGDADDVLPGEGRAQMRTVRPGRGGPPRRKDDQSGSGPAFARALALALPRVDETSGRGAATFSVARKRFLTLEDDGSAALVLPDSSDFRVQLTSVSRDELRTLVHRAWRDAAAPVGKSGALRKPKGLVLDDLREIALSLDGAEEVMPKPGVNRFFVRRQLFAKVGEASNLVGPDALDVLMIRWCADRDALLETDPLRFFTTAHYEHAVLTRLSENTRRNLPELRELLEDSWLHCRDRR